MKDYQIKSQIELIDKNKWSEFVRSHPEGNIFQTPEMYEVYKKTNKYEPKFVCILDEANKISAVLLAVIQKENKGFFGNFSARSIIWGGPLIEENNIEVLDFILKEYNKKIKGKAIYSQFRNLWEWSKEEKEVFENNSFEYEDHLDILVNLKKTNDELFNDLHAGRKKNIRRAERIPLIFEQVNDDGEIKQCELLIKATYKRIKLPYPDKSFFESAQKTLGAKGILNIFAAKYKNQIINCRYELCYNGLVYDWFAGADENHSDKYSNDFLPWKILQWAKMNGYNSFDFGGAGKPDVQYGVREYKLKFGGELVCFGRFERVNRKILILIAKVAFPVYRYFMQLKNKLV